MLIVSRAARTDRPWVALYSPGTEAREAGTQRRPQKPSLARAAIASQRWLLFAPSTRHGRSTTIRDQVSLRANFCPPAEKCANAVGDADAGDVEQRCERNARHGRLIGCQRIARHHCRREQREPSRNHKYDSDMLARDRVVFPSDDACAEHEKKSHNLSPIDRLPLRVHTMPCLANSRQVIGITFQRRTPRQAAA